LILLLHNTARLSIFKYMHHGPKKKTHYVKIKMVTVASVPNHAKERVYGSMHV